MYIMDRSSQPRAVYIYPHIILFHNWAFLGFPKQFEKKDILTALLSTHWCRLQLSVDRFPPLMYSAGPAQV